MKPTAGDPGDRLRVVGFTVGRRDGVRCAAVLPGEGVVFVVKRVKNGVYHVVPTPAYAWSERDEATLEEDFRCHMREWLGVLNPAVKCPSEEEVHAAKVRVERRVAEWLAALSRLGYRPTKASLAGVVWLHRDGYRIIPLYPRRLIGHLDYSIEARRGEAEYA